MLLVFVQHKSTSTLAMVTTAIANTKVLTAMRDVTTFVHICR